MDEDTIVEFSSRDTVSDPLTELLCNGARKLSQTAVEAKLQVFLAEFSDRLSPGGRASVVRNGHHPERSVQTGIGRVSVNIPKVRSKTGELATFRSRLVPPYVRKSKSIETALLWLYHKGNSTCEMRAALKALLGTNATGFSGKTVSLRKAQ